MGRRAIAEIEAYQLDGEEWRDIPGFDGYQASSFGRVRSVDRTVIKGNRWGLCETRLKGIILKLHKLAQNYILTVCLGAAGPQVVARLVHEAFIGPIPEGHLIGYRDEDHTNLRPENLVSTTPSCHQLAWRKDRTAEVSPAEHESRSAGAYRAWATRKAKRIAAQAARE